MREDLLGLERQRRTPFIASGEDYGAAQAVIVGLPMDWTSSYRPGSRFGPASIREVSEAIEEYSCYRDRSLTEMSFYDAGDLILPFGNVRDSLSLIAEAAAAASADGKFPVFLGGEHLVSFPVIKTLAGQYSDLRVLHFDAHADLRAAYLGEDLSHASVMRLAHAVLGDGRIYQCGIRSGDREEFAFAAAHTHLRRGSIVEAVRGFRKDLAGHPVYLTVDIDVVDPAFAPGTGTPECAGATSAELLAVFDLLADLPIVGADVVEVLPTADLSARTPLLAAVLVREILLALANGA